MVKSGMSEHPKKYGVEIVKRPHIKADRAIDLSGNLGVTVVCKKVEHVFRSHEKTFKKLADM